MDFFLSHSSKQTAVTDNINDSCTPFSDFSGLAYFDA